MFVYDASRELTVYVVGSILSKMAKEGGSRVIDTLSDYLIKSFRHSSSTHSIFATKIVSFYEQYALDNGLKTITDKSKPKVGELIAEDELCDFSQKKIARKMLRLLRCNYHSWIKRNFSEELATLHCESYLYALNKLTVTILPGRDDENGYIRHKLT